ncbi:phosphate ABC transporter substrate-binding protein [Vibrio sp. SCSIO 43136]|uniref:phosphate ABC transporter substrate-binding protein n=1 Tax=Vibrio sp. SCSIO 43136 TaxID=2819101 RepID=UPI002075B3D0|nr:phosphate ABC transporter substrate-binding protein [Vibrio sp. SCSIO 43136]USD66884.1 phosphate ABC transporter substrate-binding protein [Vibrio sp. SCSIO 43136]
MLRVAAAALLSVMAFGIQAKEVSISGSTSVGRVMDVLAEQYNKTHPETYIAVQGIGSTAGITMVNKGVTEIGMSSRYLTEGEFNEKLHVTPIAYDGLAVVVNKSNDVKDLSREQLTKIYQGKITNWKEVGGKDTKIAVVTRESSSGSRYSFESLLGLTKVINGRMVSDISPENLVVNSNSMVKTIVNHNPHAIGFVSLGSVDSSVKPITFNNVEATSKNITNNKYELARPFLVLYNEDKITEDGQSFVDYLVSSDGQTLIEDYGYTPLK